MNSGSKLRGETLLRQSNMELLRIAAMALIVSNHLVNHGILKVTSASPYALWPQGTAANRVVCAAFSTGGRIGVAVFFMITGYFLAGREAFSWRSMLRLLGRVHFFAALDFVIFLVFRISIGYGASFPLRAMALKSFVIPVTLWWFALAYAGLLILVPLLNRGIRMIRKILPGAAYPVLILFFWILYAVGTKWPVYSLLRAVLFYLMGAMIRTAGTGTAGRETLPQASDGRRPGRGTVLAAVICLAAWIGCGILTYANAEYHTGNTAFPGQYFGWTAADILNTVLIPLVAVTLLFLFEKLEIQNSRINRIAGAAFGTYLLHEYSFSRELLWHILLKVDTVQFMSPFFPALMIGDVVLIMMAGILAEELRRRSAGFFLRVFQGR